MAFTSNRINDWPVPNQFPNQQQGGGDTSALYEATERAARERAQQLAQGGPASQAPPPPPAPTPAPVFGLRDAYPDYRPPLPFTTPRQPGPNDGVMTSVHPGGPITQGYAGATGATTPPPASAAPAANPAPTPPPATPAAAPSLTGLGGAGDAKVVSTAPPVDPLMAMSGGGAGGGGGIGGGVESLSGLGGLRQDLGRRIYPQSTQALRKGMY